MASYIYDAMHPYQRTGAHFLRRAGSALLADQPGLGKTIQTLGTIIAASAHHDFTAGPQWHLIVCPKVAVKNVWEPEIARWLKDKNVETLSLTGTLLEREAAVAGFTPRNDTDHVFVIVNIESLRVKPVEDTTSKSRRDVIRFTSGKEKIKMVFAPENGVLPVVFRTEWDTIVCDESHRALIRGASAVPSQTRAGFMLVQGRRRVALSGTPMRGKPEQLWGTLNWLRPDLYRSYWNWAKTYYAMSSNGFSNYIIEGFKHGAKEALARDLANLMLRRTKAEVLPDLPPKTYAGSYLIEGDEFSPLGVWLDATTKQRRQYDRIITDGLIGDAVVNGTLAEYTRQRQVAGALHEVHFNGELAVVTPTAESPKLEWIKEWLEENDGEKLVVVSQFTGLIDVFADALAEEGYKVAKITGKISDRNRQAAIEGFQDGDVQVMLLNTKAGGVALTLDAADYLVFVDETTIPDEQEQAEDRVHRASRNHNVTVYYLRTLGTIEEEVAFVAAARQDVQQYLLDGARGVEYARKIYLQSRQNGKATA